MPQTLYASRYFAAVDMRWTLSLVSPRYNNVRFRINQLVKKWQHSTASCLLCCHTLHIVAHTQRIHPGPIYACMHHLLVLSLAWCGGNAIGQRIPSCAALGSKVVVGCADGVLHVPDGGNESPHRTRQDKTFQLNPSMTVRSSSCGKRQETGRYTLAHLRSLAVRSHMWR